MTPHPLSQSRQLQATMQLIAQRKQQVGPVTFTFGRIVPAQKQEVKNA